MGGANSAQYKKFVAHCYNAFLILRRYANLIVNLFGLMVDSSIPDIASEPDRVISKVCHGYVLYSRSTCTFFYKLGPRQIPP